MTFQRVETIKCKAFGRVFALRNLYLAACSLLNTHFDRRHHGLTCELVKTALSVVEHIPLAVDFANAAVGVARRGGRGDDITLLVLLPCTTVDDSTAVSPWTQRLVAVGVGKRVVRGRQSEFTVFGEAAVDEHVLVLDFADGRSLEETELALLVPSRNHVLHNLRTRFHGGHRRRVQFRSEGILKTPVAIYPTVVVHEHGRVEPQDAIGDVGVVAAPVADLERTVRSVALGNQSIASADLVVRVEVIGLLAVGVSHQSHVGCEQHVGCADRIEGLAQGILVHFQYLAIVAPSVEAVNRGRPDDQFSSAIVGDAAVMRTVDIDTHLARLVRVLKHVRLSVGDVFPQGEVGISSGEEFLSSCFRLLGARQG